MRELRSHAYVWRHSDGTFWQVGFEEVLQSRDTWREAYNYALQLITVARAIRDE